MKALKTSDKYPNVLSSGSPLAELVKGELVKEECDTEQHAFLGTEFPRSRKKHDDNSKPAGVLVPRVFLTVLPPIECGELIAQLIESYRTSEIQTLLDRLSHGWPNMPLWTLYKKVISFLQLK